MKDNQQRIKEENPGLSNTERFAKLAEEWNEHKKANIKDEKTDESESEKEVRDEDEVKENKKKRGKKNA
jgi:hypothetical protein